MADSGFQTWGGGDCGARVLAEEINETIIRKSKLFKTMGFRMFNNDKLVRERGADWHKCYI